MKEKNQYQKTGRPTGKPGVVNDASVQSGLSTHEQITASTAELGQAHTTGQRPKGELPGTTQFAGKSFKYR